MISQFHSSMINSLRVGGISLTYDNSGNQLTGFGRHQDLGMAQPHQYSVPRSHYPQLQLRQRTTSVTIDSGTTIFHYPNNYNRKRAFPSCPQTGHNADIAKPTRD